MADDSEKSGDEQEDYASERDKDEKIAAGDENVSDETDAGQRAPDSESTEDSKKPPKFKFECQRTGDCCKRENVLIGFADLQKWVSDQTIFRIGHMITSKVDDDEFQLLLAKDDDGFCSLYHRDNKACTIHYNKPLFCKSYPLGFNGENYVLKSKECTGVGKGKMTKEDLKQMRDCAKEDHESRQMTALVFPVLQGIFFRQLAEESKKFMEALSPEDKEKMEKLLKKDD